MGDDIIERLNAEIKEIRAAWAFETTALRAENEELRLKLDMQQATILVPSQKDDQRRIERLTSALKEALDEAAALRAQIYRAEKAYVRLDASMNRLKAAFRVNMLRSFSHMSHDEIDAEIEAAIRENEYWNMESITRNIRESGE